MVILGFFRVYSSAHWDPRTDRWARVARAVGVWSPFCWAGGQPWPLCLPSACLPLLCGGARPKANEFSASLMNFVLRVGRAPGVGGGAAVIGRLHT